MATNLQELDKLLPFLTEEEALETLESLFRKHYPSDPEYTLPFMEQGLELAKKNCNKEKEVTFSMFLALAYGRTGEFTSAIKLFDQAIVLAKNFRDKTQIAEIYNAMGALYLENQDFHNALEYFYKGLEYDIVSINARIYNNIGQVFKEKKHLEQALYYFNKSAKLKEELNQKDGVPFYLTSVGDIYREQGKHEEALGKYFECLDLCEKDNYVTLKHAVQGNIGDVYSQMGNNDEALVYYQKSLEGSKKIKDSYLISYNALAISIYHQAKQDYLTSNKFATEALDANQSINSPDSKMEALGILASNFEFLGEFEKALNYSKELIDCQSGVVKEMRGRKMDELLKAKDEQISLLESRHKVIAEKNAELRQFAQIVAHDLKEPLRTIGSFTNLLSRRYESVFDNDAAEFMDYVMQGTRQMNNLLSDLLSYVTLDNARFQLKMVNFGEVVDNIRLNLLYLIESKGAELISENLPTILAYSPPVAQVFQNLIQNALKFGPDKDCRIIVSAEEKEQHFQFCIRDNGIGIKPEYQERIFSIFTQLDNKKEGTGIGLAICKKIVQLHQGRIWVESEWGSGAAFYFTIKKFSL